MNLSNWLYRVAQRTPDRDALYLGKKHLLDYSGLWNAVGNCATHLTDIGIKPGDRVGIFMKNTPEYLIVFYAIWAAGGVVVPINGKLHPKEADWILQNADCAHVFCCDALAAGLSGVSSTVQIHTPKMTEFDATSDFEIVPRRSDDLAWLFYTSGTTGRPKGVMITHGMIQTMALGYFADVDQVHASDATLYAAPMSHGAGLYNIQHMIAGARHVVPVSGGFDEAEIFELSKHFGNTHMFAAPTMVKRLTQYAKENGETGQGIRTIVYAGGPMYLADIIEAVDHFGPKFIQIYGQGECPMGITVLPRHDVTDRTHPNWQDRLKSVGFAQSPVEVKIADDNGHDLNCGEIGEIMVRGDLVMPGYWRNPTATADTIVEGWLKTGDMGALNADGYLTLHDRSKDMIISGGTNIYPREVEEVLLQHPLVSEASVVGRPHPEWGEDVIAFVVAAGVDAIELDAFCLENMARFKRPKEYIFVPDLPKNNYGKILKTELRDRLNQ
jgi:long-chain acyl-CoA synthetase